QHLYVQQCLRAALLPRPTSCGGLVESPSKMFSSVGCTNSEPRQSSRPPPPANHSMQVVMYLRASGRWKQVIEGTRISANPSPSTVQTAMSLPTRIPASLTARIAPIAAGNVTQNIAVVSRERLERHARALCSPASNVFSPG